MVWEVQKDPRRPVDEIPEVKPERDREIIYG
jgi:hypothetical protein